MKFFKKNLLISRNLIFSKQHFCSDNKKNQTKKSNFDRIMDNNRVWASQMVKQNPQYFTSQVNEQKPQYLWIGCSDSRVLANQLLGLGCGEVFVHRNVANLAPPSDINLMAAVQFAVQYLKVKDIIVAGHYGCGGIKAAFTQHDYGPLQSWLCHIRDLRSQHKSQLIGTQQLQQKTLVQLNVKRQVLNVARIAIVQKAWAQGQQIKIHGVIYDMSTGLLKNTGLTLSEINHLPSEFRISK